MVSQKVVIKNPTGLHLRPAGILCKEAMQFKSLITFKFRENSFFYDMRERKENGRKKYEEEFFRSGLKVPDRNIDHLCGTDSSRGCCGNGKTGVAGQYYHQPDPCCPAVVSDRHAGIDRAGKTDAGGSTCEKKHETGTVYSGIDHVFCTDVLR